MAINTLLVHVDDTEIAGSRVALACRLAKTCDAHLIGFGVETPARLPYPMDTYVPKSSGVWAILKERSELAMRAAKARFDTQVESAGLSGKSEWRSEEGVPTDVLAREARFADLLVVSQIHEEISLAGSEDLVEHLLFATGRPLIVAPRTGAPESIGTHITVAWNASREAARALGDAVPLLQAARQVDIVTVDSKDDGAAGIGKVLASLGRHGVTAKHVELQSKRRSIARTLLGHAESGGGDLIVMGGYGHSRFRESVLGGVTYDLLHQSTVPLFISH